MPSPSLTVDDADPWLWSDAAPLLIDASAQIQDVVDTPMTADELTFHVYRYIKDYEGSPDRYELLDYLRNSASEVTFHHLRTEDYKYLLRQVDEICDNGVRIKNDKQCTEELLRSLMTESHPQWEAAKKGHGSKEGEQETHPRDGDNEATRSKSSSNGTGKDAATWLFENCERARETMGTTVSALDIAIHVLAHLKNIDASVRRIQRKPMLNSLYRSVPMEMRIAGAKFVSLVCERGIEIRDDEGCSEAALRKVATERNSENQPVDGDIQAAHGQGIDGYESSRGPEDRDSATGRKDAGPCFADSGTSARESTRAEGPREAQPVDGDTEEAQPSAGEKRGATYDVRGDNTSQKQRKLWTKGRRRPYGSKLIPNKDAPIPTGSTQNDRTCLVDAVNAHLLEYVPDHERESIVASLMSIVPSEGDTPIEAARGALKKYGMSLNGVSKEFFNGNRAHNILKERGPRKLIIGLRLFDLKDTKLYASHLVAWDGSVIHERPKKLRVNNTSDRLETNSIDVFNRLYHPRNYRCWQITSVYELVLV